MITTLGNSPICCCASNRSLFKTHARIASGGYWRPPRIWSKTRCPTLRLAHSATWLASVAIALTASLPTTISVSSKNTALGVSFSPSALSNVRGRPKSSKMAMVEKVVPRSMPMASRLAMLMISCDMWQLVGHATLCGFSRLIAVRKLCRLAKRS